MQLTKKELLNHISALIGFDNYALYKGNCRPLNFTTSYRVKYRNQYGFRLICAVDNRHRNIYVELDYIGAFK